MACMTHTWQCHLTDIEWDVKNHWGRQAPWQWPPSVSLHLKYILHIHAGHHGIVTVDCNFGLRGLEYGPRLSRYGIVSLGKTLHLYVHSLNPGVNGYLAGQWLLVCLNSYHTVMAAGLYAPQEAELLLRKTGLITREMDVKCIEILYNVLLYKYIQIQYNTIQYNIRKVWPSP